MFTSELTQVAAMERIKSMGMEISSIIDVGASGGVWADKAEEVWPDSNYLLIDANEHWEEKLKERVETHPKMKYLIRVVGNEDGTSIFFKDSQNPKSGHASAVRYGDGTSYVDVPSITLDTAVAETDLPGPYFLKLDTHGFEVEIFEGAKEVLKYTKLIQVEVYNFSNRGRLRFHEMCAFLEERGFRCADIADIMHRPADNILWQMDLFFIRDDRAEFSR